MPSFQFRAGRELSARTQGSLDAGAALCSLYNASILTIEVRTRIELYHHASNAGQRPTARANLVRQT